MNANYYLIKMTSSQGKKIVKEVVEEDMISINFKGQFADSDFVRSVQSAKFHVSFN